MASVGDLSAEAGDGFFNELADFAPVMIWRAGVDGLCDWFNKPWLDFTGRRMDQEIGHGWAENVHPDDFERCLDIYTTSFNERRPFTMTYRLKRSDGHYRELLDNGAAFHRNGQFAGYFGSCVDVTEFHAMEIQLRQTQKMEAIGQLTGSVAHDFNNLLTVIRGSVELLQRPNVPDARRERYIDAIGETANRAARLTSQLLAFSRRQTLTMETFDLVESIDQVSNIVRTLTGSRIKLEIGRPGTPLLVTTDRSQFDTAIVNMAVNARDAMDGEGRLVIGSASVSEIPARRAHKAIAGAFVAVTVTDSGCGISEDDLKRVFEPFFTTKDVGHGTGLGLSQVIGFAKQSGGDIVVESAVGRGSSFTLFLPRVDQAERPVGRHQRRRIARGWRRGLRPGRRGQRQRRRFRRRCAARARLRQRPRQRRAQGAGGAGLRSQPVPRHLFRRGDARNERRGAGPVRPAHLPDIPVILTSGYSDVLAKNEQHGFELLQKPYSIEQLSRALRKATGKRQAARTGARLRSEPRGSGGDHLHAERRTRRRAAGRDRQRPQDRA